MLSTPTDPDTAKRELVRTYDPPGYADPWECVEDFDRVQRYTAEHPNQGSQAVSTALDLPRGRIRGWVESDGRPDCYRGLQTALVNDWIVDDWTETARGLNQLAGWLLASGSINDNWVPLFVADTDTEIEQLQDAFDLGGVAPMETRNDPDRPREWRPTTDASVLGRVLHTWSGVRGDKSQTVMQFPRYPAFAPIGIAREFATIYVNLRGTHREDRSTPLLQLQERRSDAYREAFVDLLKRVVSDSDDVRGNSWPILLRGDAVEELSWA